MIYHRYTNKNHAVSDYTGFGMFTADERRVEGGHYGKIHFTYDGANSVNIEDMKERFIKAWEDYKDCTPDYMQGLTAENFYECFDPEDIVDDAGAWDNSDFRLFFSDYIDEGEAAIILSNGAIVFDENLAKME